MLRPYGKNGSEDRHYNRKKDGDVPYGRLRARSRRYKDKGEEWARCIVPLHGRGEGVPMRILLQRILEG